MAQFKFDSGNGSGLDPLDTSTSQGYADRGRERRRSLQQAFGQQIADNQKYITSQREKALKEQEDEEFRKSQDWHSTTAKGMQIGSAFGPWGVAAGAIGGALIGQGNAHQALIKKHPNQYKGAGGQLKAWGKTITNVKPLLDRDTQLNVLGGVGAAGKVYAGQKDRNSAIEKSGLAPDALGADGSTPQWVLDQQANDSAISAAKEANALSSAVDVGDNQQRDSSGNAISPYGADQPNFSFAPEDMSFQDWQDNGSGTDEGGMLHPPLEFPQVGAPTQGVAALDAVPLEPLPNAPGPASPENSGFHDYQYTGAGKQMGGTDPMTPEEMALFYQMRQPGESFDQTQGSLQLANQLAAKDQAGELGYMGPQLMGERPSMLMSSMPNAGGNVASGLNNLANSSLPGGRQAPSPVELALMKLRGG